MPTTPRKSRFATVRASGWLLIAVGGRVQAHTLSPDHPATDALLHALQAPTVALGVALAVVLFAGKLLASAGRVRLMWPLPLLAACAAAWAMWVAGA
jgi:hypothetical protein